MIDIFIAYWLGGVAICLFLLFVAILLVLREDR